MKTTRILAAAVGGVIVAVAGVAVAANMSSGGQVAFYQPGQHEFHVWCAGGADYTAVGSGKNAEDAQMKVYDSAKAHGRTSCWPVWQRRVSD